MDKNTITGLVLIAAVVIGFSIFNRPSEEEIARQNYLQDSITNAQKNEIKDEIEEASKESINKGADVSTFFNASSITNNPVANDSINNGVAQNDSLPIAEAVVAEEIKSLENDLIKIDFTTKGGQVAKVQIKNYTTFEDKPLYLTDKDGSFSLELMNKQGVKLQTSDLNFQPIQDDNAQTLIMRMNYSNDQHIDFIYALDPNSYILKFSIAVVGMNGVLDKQSTEELQLYWTQKMRRQEKSTKSEQHYSRIYYKFYNGDVEDLSETSNDEASTSLGVRWVAFKDQFFASTLIAEKQFSNINMKSKILESNDDYLKQYETSATIPTKSLDANGIVANMEFFYGPLEYYMLKSYDDDIADNAMKLNLDKLIPLGWSVFRVVNQYFVIPLFNLLVGSGLQMGIVILLLTIIVKLIISPLTYKSFLSSAKMKVLRPQVEELNEKYPGQEKAMERQKATMALYSQAGVNPMSGCIPMLLQMPILIALFAFFPSAIELRHQSFLWADDLSTYDAIIEWSSNIPLVSSFLGNHISLFCVLMTVTNIIYTKFNMDATNTGQQQMPGMKWMMMFMPIIFFFVLNNYPSGLTYYYFLSTLMTIIITMAFRYFVDENKILAKLEENKKKPKKKGFMSRIQEQAEQAQRMQQAQAKQKNKKKK